MPRPTPGELAAAQGLTLADVIAPDLDVLFCGINPGLLSALTGHHFARPGNRFWPALHRSGFTPRQFAPEEQQRIDAWCRAELTRLDCDFPYARLFATPVL